MEINEIKKDLFQRFETILTNLKIEINLIKKDDMIRVYFYWNKEVLKNGVMQNHFILKLKIIQKK